MADMSFHLLITTEILPDIAILGSLNLDTLFQLIHVGNQSHLLATCIYSLHGKHLSDSHLTNACIYALFQQKLFKPSLHTILCLLRF